MNARFYAQAFFHVLLLVIACVALLAGCAQDICYQMPDKVTCRYQVTGDYSTRWLEFYGCENNLRYIAPATYKEVRCSK